MRVAIFIGTFNGHVVIQERWLCNHHDMWDKKYNELGQNLVGDIIAQRKGLYSIEKTSQDNLFGRLLDKSDKNQLVARHRNHNAYW